jgi:membrane protein required for colicin V production
VTVTALDAVLAIVLLAVVAKVTLSGFVAEFFSKAAAILGLACALLSYGKIAPFVVRFLGADVYPGAIAFLAVFLAVYLVVKGTQQLVGSVFEGESMHNLDRALGFFLGVVEGALLVATILVALKSQPWFDVEWLLKDSVIMRLTGPFLPDGNGIIRGLTRSA